MILFRGEEVPAFADKILVHYDVLYCNPDDINDGDVVYCDTHHLPTFKDILNQKRNLTIITHNSDHCVCDSSQIVSNAVITDDYLCYKKWYAQNCYSEKLNVFPIPIGFENRRWESIFGPKNEWLEQVSKEEVKQSDLVYFNCNLSTNLRERKECCDFSTHANFVTIDSPNLTYLEYLRRIKQHKFTLSPRGNGLDCHRTWEVLKLKRIPIIKREGRLEELYRGLPVLFVDDWSELHTMNLDDFYETFCFGSQDYL